MKLNCSNYLHTFLVYLKPLEGKNNLFFFQNLINLELIQSMKAQYPAEC